MAVPAARRGRGFRLAPGLPQQARFRLPLASRSLAGSFFTEVTPVLAKILATIPVQLRAILATTTAELRNVVTTVIAGQLIDLLEISDK